MTPTVPLVSVIIATYNAASKLLACLNTLQTQTYQNLEIIVVDDGSTDQTQAILKSSPQVRTFTQTHQGPAVARNLGARHAHGDILVFLDADMTFAPDCLIHLVAPIQKGETQGTFTRDEYVANWDNPYARCWNFQYTGMITKRRLPPDTPTTSPVFRALTKKAFDSVGGFDPGGYDDDYSLARKLGFPAQAAPGAVIYHANPDSLSAVFHQAVWVASRRYKFGNWGKLYALFRANPLFSLIIGLVHIVSSHEPLYLIFKLVYNGGITWGIIVSYGHQNSKK